jgi:hypothetical protein
VVWQWSLTTVSGKVDGSPDTALMERHAAPAVAKCEGVIPMNRILIVILDIINKLLALFLVIASVIGGYLGDFRGYTGADYVQPHSILGAVVGFVVGLALAGIFCGFLAAVITIARELIAIRELLAVRVWTAPPRP